MRLERSGAGAASGAASDGGGDSGSAMGFIHRIRPPVARRASLAVLVPRGGLEAVLPLEAPQCQSLQRAGEEEPLELLDLAAAFHGDVGIGDIVGQELRDAELDEVGE